VVHGLTPPHPARAARRTGVSTLILAGTIMYGLIIGIPTAIVAGPLFRAADSQHIKYAGEQSAGVAVSSIHARKAKRANCPASVLRYSAFLLPVILMLISAVGRPVSAPKRLSITCCIFGRELGRCVAGSRVLFSSGASVHRRGFNREQIQKFCGECLAPIAGITLIVARAAGFENVLRESGISQES